MLPRRRISTVTKHGSGLGKRCGSDDDNEEEDDGILSLSE